MAEATAEVVRIGHFALVHNLELERLEIGLTGTCGTLRRL